jgi:hypothetical protein
MLVLVWTWTRFSGSTVGTIFFTNSCKQVLRLYEYKYSRLFLLLSCQSTRLFKIDMQNTSDPNIFPTTTCPTNAIPSIPIQLSGPWCGLAFQFRQINNSDNATTAMKACCQSAPIIFVDNNCDIYCSPINQTTDQLARCLGSNYGRSNGNTTGVACDSQSTSKSAAPTFGPHGNSKMTTLLVGLLAMGVYL